jgi:hypothetical protein
LVVRKNLKKYAYNNFGGLFMATANRAKEFSVVFKFAIENYFHLPPKAPGRQKLVYFPQPP